MQWKSLYITAIIFSIVIIIIIWRLGRVVGMVDDEREQVEKKMRQNQLEKVSNECSRATKEQNTNECGCDSDMRFDFAAGKTIIKTREF